MKLENKDVFILDWKNNVLYHGPIDTIECNDIIHENWEDDINLVWVDEERTDNPWEHL